MSAQEDGAAAFDELRDELTNVVGAFGIEPVRGLVEEDERRFVEESTRNMEALTHSPRVLLDESVTSGRKLDEVEHRSAPIARHLPGQAVKCGEVFEVLHARESPVEAAFASEHQADALSDACGLRFDVEPEHAGGAAAG